MSRETLFMRCHFCDLVISKQVARGASLAPWEAIRWYERMIRHIRSTHSRKPAP